MKDKFTNFTAKTDVTDIECNLTCAEIRVEQSPDENFTVEYPAAKNIHVGNGNGGLLVKQDKRPVFSGLKQQITIYVPAHTLPKLSVNGKNFNLTVKDGIYDRLSVNADSGKVRLSGCVFGGVDVLGGDLDINISGATVKDSAHFKIERGNVLAENTFATRSEYKVKRGNIGLFNVACKDCAADTQRGNITATLAGGESNFNATLITGDGSINRESVVHEGADCNFKAYAKKGNVALDFLKEKEN